MQFNKKRTGVKSARIILIFLAICGLAAPLICTEMPYFLRINGENHFPAFNRHGEIIVGNDTSAYSAIDFRSFRCDMKWMAPIVYGTVTLDNELNAGASPFSRQKIRDATGKTIGLPMRYRHWLGTTKTGRDVTAIVVFGIRTAMIVGGLSTLLAAIIGILLGFASGYFGNSKLVARRGTVLTLILLLAITSFETSRIISSDKIIEGLAATTLFAVVIIGLFNLLIKKLNYFAKRIEIPVDDLINSFSSGFIALPQLILILGLMTMVGPSYSGVILCIGLTSWPLMARAVRSQALKLHKETFIESAKASGISPFRIAWKHFLPNIFETILVVSITGFTSAILTEAGLSFLGAGLPFGSSSWGGIMAEGRNDLGSWWLVAFPGMALTVTGLALSRISIRISHGKD